MSPKSLHLDHFVFKVCGWIILVRRVWSIPCNGQPSQVVIGKLKNLKKALKSWNLEVFGDLNANISRKSAELRSRVKWFQDGDRNSSFFHSSIKRRQCRSVLYSLSIDGVISADQTVIKDHIVRFYVDLFSSNLDLIDHDLSIMDDIVPSLVSQEENSLLVDILSADVIHDAMFAIDALSAPGPNGFSGRFFQRC
ncbi:hypothetical protein Dsin_017516 [Dipteronia sinensis]|uniref:Reverse transcriptase n=1 Tax=Dipteronia sinensis TaxID=43782 RepID=A0AAE0E6Z7_9ROSI|nr:hypothetical protein Dsin_017516 [Dipteronia sinensis]